MGKEVAKVVASFRQLESRWPPKNNSDQVAYSSKPSVIREFKEDISGIKGNENSHLVQDDTTVTTDKKSESLCSPKSNSNQVNCCQPSATLVSNEATNGIKYHEKSNQGQELPSKQVAEVVTDKSPESNCAPKNNSNQDSSQLQSLCAPKGNSNQDSSQLHETPGSKNAICDMRDNETSLQEQEVPDIRNISFDQVGSANKHAAQKLNQKVAASKSDNVGKAQSHCLVPHPCTLAIVKHHASVAEASGSLNKPVKAHNSHLASISNSSLTHGKALQPDKKMHHHNTDDSCSVASSAASFRSLKGRRTIGNAPSFKCSERAEKRKEYYTKLEQKHRAMEAEKLQIEARIKEEQDTALKEFRKNLIVKANPLPSFYAKGPPPKAELKKVPPTRAKSPKFSRRQSFSDANPLQGEKYGGACDRLHRHDLCPIVKSSKSLPNSPKAVKGKGTKTNEGSKLSTLSTAN
ncbi:protein WVD2-like 1 [Zingiber officinale]|uniref:protein WVD2-like 1 n=1 Tax=Zingiber officinale TaxID=94328 RepID=UPI001C4DD7F9|nr:protein WVD2-like 1 [Zingiber officinale]XP_042378465.1 protein WVD2-like 1 [Zingiber officinale]